MDARRDLSHAAKELPSQALERQAVTRPPPLKIMAQAVARSRRNATIWSSANSPTATACAITNA